MSDTDLPNSDDPAVTPDLQAALAAAFGDEAMDWNEETPAAGGASDDGADMAVLANMLADANSADDPSAALDDLLKKVSSAIDEGDLPEQLGADAASQTDEESQQETGVRHVVFEIGDRQFGLPLDGVLEIDRCGKVTSLPLSLIHI